MIAHDALSWAGLLADAAQRLRTAGVEPARREARLLLAHVLHVSQEDILVERLPPATRELAYAFDVAVKRRGAREPFAYIAGRREFWSLEFVVAPGVLIPRPESELLVELALNHFSAANASLRVLDLGTGSGCLMLSFLSERPHAQGVGVDLSDVALTVASANAASLGLPDRARFVHSDWFENVSGAFDVMFINPPYIPHAIVSSLESEVRTYEPHTALDGGPDGLDAYRRIIAHLEQHLDRAGRAFFEIGQGQAADVAALISARGLKVEGTVCDLAGLPRCVVVTRT